MGRLTATVLKDPKPKLGSGGKAVRTIMRDGDGLFLLIKPTGACSWMLRVQSGGKRRDIGLGALSKSSRVGSGGPLADLPLMLRKSLTLAEAREKAAILRKVAHAGADPVVERDRERTVHPTFSTAMEAAHSELAAGWSEKTAKSFLASLTDHALPKLGKLRVDSIGASDIILALSPIWNDKPVIARKVRSRVLQVLAFAKARGWRTDNLPDVRELRSGLSRQTEGGNFAAMPFTALPDFVADQLGLANSASRAAMLFAILTAARSGEVRNATWEQIDIEARAWTRPASIMKMNKEHVVTLSVSAIAVLERMAPTDLRKGLIFPGAKLGKPLSDMSLTKIMRMAGRTETVHGFRSAFRDWAAETMPTIPAMVAEMALAHKVGTATEQAYLRSDLRDMRRALMDAWGRFAAPSLSGVAGNVTPLKRAEAG